MFDMLRRTMPETIALSTRIDADIWPVLVDPSQVEQVVLNLVLNARDAMPQGGSLTIGLQNRALDKPKDIVPAGEYVALVVTDRGSGMTQETMARIFEPFFTTKPPG